MLGVFVNMLTILLGTLIGILFRKLLPEKLGDAVMKGMALCVLYIGVSGMLKGQNPIIAILSIAIGAVIGTLLDLDGLLTRFGAFIERKLVKKEEGTHSTFGEAFVSSSLLFCVGAMAVVGSLQAGMGDCSVLYAKAVIDGISAIFFASSLGFGVVLSAVTVFVYQGTITLLADRLQGLLTNEAIVAEMTCVGSLLIIALSFNMLGITKFKVMNYLPAIFLPILFCLFL